MGFKMNLLSLFKKSTLIGIFVFLQSLNSFAIQSLKIDTGRYVAYELNLEASNQPTFIFLPGIYRGWTSEDTFIKNLKKEHINFVALHYSLQPESILQIPQNETAFVKNHFYTDSDLAQEVEILIKNLKISKPLLVSLSYSSLVSTTLSQSHKYSPIIETAPMIRYDESNPSGGKITDFWENLFNLNPFTGPIITKWYLQQTYYQFWTNEIANMVKNEPQSPKTKISDLMIESYTQMSMIAHGFDFTKQNFADGVQRYFILGRNEDRNRYKLQLAAIEEYEKKSGYTKSTAILSKAGHIVPVDSPDEYVQLLKTFLN